jgi:molybdopterin synthase catalytic subunit
MIYTNELLLRLVVLFHHSLVCIETYFLRNIFGSLIFFLSSCIGITRDNFEGRRVARLSYEAYEPMALQELNRLCDNAREKFPGIEHIAICHRLGLVFNY